MAKFTVRELLIDLPIGSLRMGWKMILFITAFFSGCGSFLSIFSNQSYLHWLSWSAGIGFVFAWVATALTFAFSDPQ